MTASDPDPHDRGAADLLARGWLEAQEAERRAIARDLHDDVGQVITALRLSALELSATLASREQQGLAEDVIALAEDALARLRRVAHGLRPPQLDTLGLLPSVDALCDGLARSTGIEITLLATPAALEMLPQPEPHIALAAYRIVQEALANALRHAAARQIVVEIAMAASTDRNDDALCITVSDDGRGHDTATAPGFGRLSMRERAALAGGTFAERSTVAGTCVTVTLPVQGDRRPEQY